MTTKELKVNQLQGKALLARRWRGTLEISLTDEKTGERLSRAVTMEEVWDDEEIFTKFAHGLADTLLACMSNHIEKGVGISGKRSKTEG